MSDWLLLGFLATGFYLYECCTWTPATAWACVRKPFRRTWSASIGAELPGNESGGFALSDPLRLSGNIIHCSHWPLAVSPDGICLDTADADWFRAFESIHSIVAEERAVFVNGEIACRAASESLAFELAGYLSEIRAAPPARRSEFIGTFLAQSFDPNILRASWSRFQESARALTILALLPLGWLAIVTPIALALFGPLRAWPFLLGGLFLTSLSVSAEFIRVHRKELPAVSDRWLHAISMTLFPIAAIRAVDRMSKEIVAQFSPCAVVGVFCSEADGDPILRRLGFDLEQGLMSAADSPASSCRLWYRAQRRTAFNRLLTSLERDPFTRPQRVDPLMVSYCPRCHSQFGEGTEECSDCVEVRLMPLAETEAPKRRHGGKRKRA